MKQAFQPLNIAILMLAFLAVGLPASAQAKRRPKAAPPKPCNAQVADAPTLFDLSLGLEKAALDKRWPSFAKAYLLSNRTYLTSPMRIDYAQVSSKDMERGEVPAGIDFTLSFYEGKLYSYLIEYNDPKVITVQHLIAKLAGETTIPVKPGPMKNPAVTVICDGVVMELWSRGYLRNSPAARIMVVDRRVDEKLTDNNMLIEPAKPDIVGKLRFGTDPLIVD